MTDHLIHLQTSGSHHGRYCQEEGKLSGGLAGKLLRHTSHYGGHTSAYTWYHGDTLDNTDDEGTTIGEPSLLGTMTEDTVTEEHKYSSYDQHHCNDDHTAQCSFDIVI